MSFLSINRLLGSGDLEEGCGHRPLVEVGFSSIMTMALSSLSEFTIKRSPGNPRSNWEAVPQQ